MITIDHLVLGVFQVNTYFLISPEKSVLIVDPGGSGKEIEEYITEKGLKPALIINTHGHPDHTEANSYLKDKFDIPVLISHVDGNVFGIEGDCFIQDGEVIDFEGHELKVMLTPGHTMGSVCIKGEGFLLTGDTLFSGSIGRTDLGGNMKAMQKTLSHCFEEIPDDTILYSGHGPKSTMGAEKRENPYLIEARLKEE